MSPSCLPARWPARFLVHGGRTSGRHDGAGEAFCEGFNLPLDLLGQSVELTGRVLHQAGSPQEQQLSANCGW